MLAGTLNFDLLPLEIAFFTGWGLCFTVDSTSILDTESGSVLAASLAVDRGSIPTVGTFVLFCGCDTFACSLFCSALTNADMFAAATA